MRFIVLSDDAIGSVISGRRFGPWTASLATASSAPSPSASVRARLTNRTTARCTATILQCSYDADKGNGAVPDRPSMSLMFQKDIPIGSGRWLGDLDSNQDCPSQSREFYR